MLTLKTNTMKYKNADGVMQDVGAIIGEKTTDASLSQAGFPADAKAVGEKFSQLQDTIDNLKISGLTTAQVNSLNGMFKKCAFTSNATTEYEAFKSAFGITESGGEVEPDIPDEPDTPEVTLKSISATYTGGEVATGTALTSLTGITVTATYSDGTTKTVTGYTLSGEILEGENTITVSYGGKSTTFTVTGIVESGGGDTTAELVTDGLVAFFDFRTATYNNEGADNTTLWTPTQGNGQLFAWAKNQVTTQDEYGYTSAGRRFMFDRNGSTSETDFGTEFTFIHLNKGDIIGANITATNIDCRWQFQPKYVTTTGSTTTATPVSGFNYNSDDKTDYNFMVIRVKENELKMIMDTSVYENDASAIDDFASWFSKVSCSTYTNGAGYYVTGLAIYDRALTDVEIEEMRAFFKTLEVA